MVIIILYTQTTIYIWVSHNDFRDYHQLIFALLKVQRQLHILAEQYIFTIACSK